MSTHILLFSDQQCSRYRRKCC